MNRTAALVVLAAVSACSAGVPSGGPRPLPKTAAGAIPPPKAGPVDSPLPAPSPHRTPLGEVRASPLVISEILAEVGDDSALAVHQFAGADLGYVQRIDGKTGVLGPVIVLDREPVIGSFARGDDWLLATTHDGAVCLSTYHDGNVVQRGCDLKQGDALVPFGDRYVSLWTEPAEEAVEKRAQRNDKEREPKREPPKESPRGAKKKPGHAKGEPKVTASPKKLALVRQFVTADGALDGDDEVTDLTFVSPMPGMAIVGATSSGARARILFYEYTGAAKGRPKTVIGKSRLALGSLDEHGAYDAASRKSFPDGDLMFGFLADHQDPRVLPTSRGALYLGLTSSHGKCEAAVVSPFFMQMIPNDDLCAYQPGVFFDIAGAVRDAQKGGSNGGKAATPEGPRMDPILRSARRAYGQPSYDLPHAALFGDHAYALVSGEGDRSTKVVRFSDPMTVEDVARPLVASRLRIAWGAFAPDGSGVAAVEGHVMTVSASGNVVEDAPVDATLSLLDRPDVSRVERALATKIGDAFYQSRGAIRQIAPAFEAEPVAKLVADAALLVGGEHVGLVLEVGGPTFSVSRFEPPRVVRPLSTLKAEVLAGFDAVARVGGGALVAGAKRGDPTKVVAFAIDEQGRASELVDTGMHLAAGDTAVRLTSLPGGTALLTDMNRTEVAWLDDGARVLASRAWPTGTSGARCVDGRAAPTEVPTPSPGVFVHVADLATDGACLTSEIAWAPDGSLRWFGSTSVAPHSRAELGLVPGLVSIAPAPSAVTTFVAALAALASPCPSDMVSIEGRYCVDRYESTLVDGKGRWLSPDYSATEGFMSLALSEWSTKRERTGDLFARAMPLPELPDFEEGGVSAPVAVNRAGIRPSGYVTGITAKAACEATGKRLCTLDEWHKACRGEKDQQFPYGTTYQDGVCNVNREAHPAAMLHGHSSIGHLDPRLDRVASSVGPLMRVTGGSPACASQWGDDAIFDMVGNLDEWIDEKSGAFAGGFFSRGTKNGCEALVDAHPAGYLDYSTGIRCCRDASPP